VSPTKASPGEIFILPTFTPLAWGDIRNRSTNKPVPEVHDARR
jgi:hypothetical protein